MSYLPAVSREVGLETAKPKAEVPAWELVFSKDYPEARRYRGLCTHEDVAFLIDPTKLLIDWKRWAKEELYKDIEFQYGERNLTPLRLKIYVGKALVLWGLAEYPAIRIESWHYGSPAVIHFLIAIIGVVIVVWAFLAWLFQKAEEVEWIPPVIGIGALAFLFFALALLVERVERRR